MRLPGPVLIGLLLPGIAGCGYRIGPGEVYAWRSVKLEIFDSRPERRTHEFALSHVIARELLDSGIRVNASDAPFILKGDIVSYDERVSAVDALDVPLAGSLTMVIHVRLADAKTGDVVMEDSRRERSSFSYRRDETREMARREVYDRLARWVATKLEHDW